MPAPTRESLHARLAELVDLQAIGSVLHWDMLVTMPHGGADARGEQLATLERLAHEQLVDPALGELLDAAGDDPAARVARRDRDKALRVPADLVAEIARAAAVGQAAWHEAREAGDFAAFAPHLERQLELRRSYASCFPEVDEPYDALLDDFEPGMRTAEARDVLGRLKDGLVPLVAHCRERSGAVDPGPLDDGPFPVAQQRTLVRAVLQRLGVQDDTWRLDESAHPFQTAIGRHDIRLTTRYDEASMESLFSTLHEFGHALYEAQVDPAYERTPLRGGVSMTVHESQSRLWENMVGRSHGFWRWCAPLMAERFPQSAAAGAEGLWRAANVVRPTLIRVDADEVTYALHILLRFELELELLSGALAVRDLPERWNALTRELLGVEVPDVRDGVLQDVHWSEGAFGYFPTYALGNVLSGQLWQVAQQELGDLEEAFAAGEFAALRGWLGERIHRHGRRYEPAELVRRVAGGPLDPGPYLAYLREKVERVYGPVT